MSDRSSGDVPTLKASHASGGDSGSCAGNGRARSQDPARPVGGSSPLVRAVVVSSQGGPNLAACLKSLERERFPGLAVTMVDNASPGGAAQAAASFFPRMDIVRNPKNLGFAGGANTGLRQALAEGARYALVLNDDVTLLPGCIQALIRTMEADPRLGACQPLILDAANATRVASAGCHAFLTGRCGDLGAGGHVTDISAPDCNSPHGPIHKGPAPGGLTPGGVPPEQIHGRAPDAGSAQEGVARPDAHPGHRAAAPAVQPVPAVTGAAMFLRIEALALAGLFDENFFMYFEDVELSFRIRRHGFETVCIGPARALHIGGGTASKLPSWQKIARCERNALALAARHSPPLEAALALALGPLSSLAAALYRLGIGRPMDALAYAAGSLAGLALGFGEIAKRLVGRGCSGALPEGSLERWRIFP